jgi:hypothetical protein
MVRYVKEGRDFKKANEIDYNTIALVDTRPELPGETIGTVVSTHGTIAAAFKANEAFQSRMRASGVKSPSSAKRNFTRATGGCSWISK